ncbi:MAG: stress response translation initiation inhibitor YciH [Candidatus Aenigmarchaeota archaeon ex4484_56]|nr:MAG: stress response translation initiation inhibitor YciH [Candidatus Aenigmarchaeota archaeon ex4484_56]
MSDICSTCGLPKDICTCESVAKEEQKIIIYTAEGRYRKKITVISGIDQKQVDIKQLLKKLKRKFACGGTIKNNELRLQGEHKEKIRYFLISENFRKDQIEIK